MKANRIVILAMLAIVLSGSASASAFDFNFLTGSNGEVQEITVGGIHFNMPAGFSENENYTLDHENLSSEDFEYYISSVGYEDASKDNAIYILVEDFGQENVSADVVKEVGESMDGQNKTVNGHDGYIIEQNNNGGNESLIMQAGTNDYIFLYADNGDMVYVGATDPSYFEQVIKK